MHNTLILVASLAALGTNSARAADIPVNVGIGPAAFYVPEHLDDEDPEPFYGLRLNVKAIINRDIIKKYKGQIPPQYRSAVEKVDEIRVGYLLIPESIMLGSRKTPHGPEIYGATWRPLGIGLPIKMGPARLSLGTGLLITYAYINTGDYKIVDQTDEELEDLRDPDDVKFRHQVTHFFRPGADVNLDFEVQFTESFLASIGWSSAYYVPQEIGGSFGSLGMDDLQKSIWRLHQAYAMLHYRFPVEAKL
jgi:hypothetical protein